MDRVPFSLLYLLQLIVQRLRGQIALIKEAKGNFSITEEFSTIENKQQRQRLRLPHKITAILRMDLRCRVKSRDLRQIRDQGSKGRLPYRGLADLTLKTQITKIKQEIELGKFSQI